MFRILLKKQLFEIFRMYFYNAKKNTARSRAATIAFFAMFVLLMVVVIGGIFTAMALVICQPLVSAGGAWLYYAIMGLVAIVLGTFGSVFNTYSELYAAKDNDLLFAMPIPVRVLMASRLASVFLMGLMYSAVVVVPAVAVYCAVAGFSLQALAGGVVLLVDISLVVFVLSCALGWVVGKLSLRMKNKAVSRVIIALACVAIYYVGYFVFSDMLTDMVNNPGVFVSGIESNASALCLFGQAGTGDPFAMGVFSAAAVVLTAITWFVMERSFLGIATATGVQEKRALAKISYGQKSPRTTLLGRELRRLLGSSDYMLNCALGVVFLPAMAIYVLIASPMINEAIVGMSEFAPAGFAPMVAFAVLCLVSTMVCTAIPSVSLEGKNLWIVKSLPVDSWKVIEAKLSLQLLLMGAPLLVCAVIVGLAINLSPAEVALLVVACAAFTLFMSVADMCLAVKTPILSWTTEQAAIKQNLSMLVSIMGGWAIVVAIAFVYLWQGWNMGFVGYAAATAAVLLVAENLLYRWLRREGVRRFEAL